MFRKPLFWAIILILIIGGAAAGYYYYTGGFTRAQTQTAQENQVTTAPVATGDLIIRVDGVGNLLASQELKLGFGTSGVVKSVGVQPGDQVKVGTVLATLDDTTARYDVVEAGVTLRQTQLQLAKLTQPTAASIAEAKATLASAQADLTKLTQPAASQVAAAQADLLSAQQAYSILVGAVDPNKQTSLQADLKSAEVALAQAQSAYNKISWRGDVGATTESANLQNATIAYEKSKADYDLNAEGPAADAISAARAKISTAQDTLTQLTHPDVNTVEASKAKVAAAQASLDSLTKGGDPQDVELAQLAVQQAEDSLRAKMLDLANTVITSPITGTVTAADVTIGQQASTGSAITVDQTPQVRFWIDESDAGKVAVGNTVNVTFGAYDTLPFTGKIVRIDPALVTVNGSNTVQVWASVEQTEHPVQLLYNMSADVEVISGEARNALLVPVQALRQLGPGQFAVFVKPSTGDLEMRPVKVGLRDAINAQILDGVKAGEQVSIASARAAGTTQTGATQTGGAGAGQGGGNRQGGANGGAGR
ncbi:efflux RND transporter periplasmic adaptor subunit [soil metagenome]